jgi:hypothetical protein
VSGFCPIIANKCIRFRRDPGSNPACGRHFFAEILKSFDIPGKRISIMMLTSIFLKKCMNRKKYNQYKI